jgi:hypothetical protein
MNKCDPMMNIKEKYDFKSKKAVSKFPIIIGIVGLIVIVSVIVVFSFFPAFYSEPLTLNEAENRAQQYVNQYYGENLQIHEIMEFSNNFYVIVQEETTGINAFELLVDRYGEGVTPEPGPNMMWNTKYQMGMHHGGFPSGPMTISAQEASEIAQNWLKSNFPGSVPKEPMEFYGYYTFDFSRDGNTLGMLSVNGYSGEVWYHNWHGQSIRSRDYS